MADQSSQDLDLSHEDSVQGPIHETVTLQGGLKTPDLTPAHIGAMIAAVANFGNAFGIYHLNAAQQDSLTKATIALIGVVGGDAIIRLGRNLSKRL